MCGIAGIFSFQESTEVQLPSVISMTKAMTHRGPDDEGFITVGADGKVRHYLGDDSPARVRAKYSNSKPASSNRGNVSYLALGHRRLSILDISPAGHQPMSDPTGRYWIVFNGEIYNFREIRKNLQSLGHNFLTSSDTEVILAAYTEWKEGCLSKFNGDFSFALWDNQQNSLFCARDRIGIKPFYYSLTNDRIIFGSDIKTLIASGLHQPEPDQQGLYLSMAFGIAPRPLTAFKGIRALEQSHWMRLHSDGRIEKARYWQIPTGTEEPNMRETEAAELLEEQLQKAVKRRLVADVPVGTFMSGGIDSTTISAIAAQQHPGIKAFTLGFQNDAPELDEIPQAEATGRMYQMQHIVKRVNPDESLKDLQSWIDGYEEPYYSLAANHVISQLVQENNVTVVLNGLGGDELLAGYSYSRFHRVPAIPLLNPLVKNADRLQNTKVAKALRMIGVKSPDRLHTLLFRKTSDVELCRLFHPSFYPQQETLDLLHDLYAKDLNFSNTLEAISHMDLMNYVGNHHVHRVDQFTMAHSVEGRFPFLDHELIEATFRIPAKLKIRKGNQKYILRQVAKKYIAPECLTMKKKGFGLPLKQWMQGSLKPLVESSLENLGNRPQIDTKTVATWHKAYTLGQIPSERIWHLVALELWFNRFIDPGMPRI